MTDVPYAASVTWRMVLVRPKKKITHVENKGVCSHQLRAAVPCLIP